MKIPQEEYEKAAKEINDAIFGADRKKKLKFMDSVKLQINAGVKFALEKALSSKAISQTGRNAFVELLREQKDAINILMVDPSMKQKSAEMLKPIFGHKALEFIDNFQDIFGKVQSEVQLDLKAPVAT